MAITVQMIENKEFTTAPMGYKRKEVDMFLDEICDEMDRLNDEIQSLQIKLSQASQAAAQPMRSARPAVSVPAPLDAVEPAPEAEEKAPAEPEPKKAPLRTDLGAEAAALLQAAQRVYKETVNDAKNEAKRIVDEAQAKVDDQLKLQQKEREEMDEALRTLRESAREYRKKLETLLTNQQKLLDDAAGLFEEN